MEDGWLPPKTSFFHRFSTPESCTSSFLAWKLSKMLFDPESRAKLEESFGLDGPSKFLGIGYLCPLPLRSDLGYLLRFLTDLRRQGEIHPLHSVRLFNLFWTESICPADQKILLDFTVNVAFYPLPLNISNWDIESIQAVIEITACVFDISVSWVIYIPFNGLYLFSVSWDPAVRYELEKSPLEYFWGLASQKSP